MHRLTNSEKEWTDMHGARNYILSQAVTKDSFPKRYLVRSLCRGEVLPHRGWVPGGAIRAIAPSSTDESSPWSSMGVIR